MPKARHKKYDTAVSRKDYSGGAFSERKKQALVSGLPGHGLSLKSPEEIVKLSKRHAKKRRALKAFWPRLAKVSKFVQKDYWTAMLLHIFIQLKTLRSNRKKIEAGALAFLLVFTIVMPFIPTEFAKAATATALPDGDVTTQWAGQATPHWSKIDEDVAGTPNTADYIATGGPGTSADAAAEEVTFATVSNVSSASSVVVRINSKSATNANGGTLDALDVQLRIGGVLQAAQRITPQYHATATTYPTTSALTFNGSWTQSDIDGMQVLVTRVRQGGGNPTNQQDDVRIAALSATVTYTPGVNFEQSAYRWFENLDASESYSYVKAFGSINFDSVAGVAITSDGGYAISGSTNTYGSGSYDMLTAKFNAVGELTWVRVWGGANDDLSNSIAATNDGGVVVAGETNNYGSGVNDVVMLRYSSTGSVTWSKATGSTNNEGAKKIIASSDGGFALVGYTQSYGQGSNDAFIAKYTSSGSLSWSRTWGGTGSDQLQSLYETSDGGFVAAGITQSYGLGGNEAVLLKFSLAGTLEWQRVFGTASTDWAHSVAQLDNGDIVVTGYLNGGVTSGQIYMTTYSSAGTYQSTSVWGAATGVSYSVAPTADGGYVIAGQTTSYGVGSDDAMLVKISSTGTISWSSTLGSSGTDTFSAALQTEEGGYIASGRIALGAGGGDISLAKFSNAGTIVNCTSSNCTSPSVTLNSSSPSNSTPTGTVTSPVPTVQDVSGTSVTPSPTLTSIIGIGPSMSVSNPLAALSTPATAADEGTPFRLRMNLHGSIANADPGTATFKLQYAQRGADNLCDTSFTNETYSDVSATSGAIRYANNTNAVDGQSLQTNANDPTHSTDSVVAQTYEESNNFGISSTIANGADGMWDFALKAVDGAANTSYCFRTVYSTGNLLSAYSAIPEITTPSPEYAQGDYKGYDTYSPTFARALGGASTDYGAGVITNENGDYLAAGYTGSTGAGHYDMVLAKYTKAGAEAWRTTWGGVSAEITKGIEKTPDGKYVVVGATATFGNGGGNDAFIVQLNDRGLVEWSLTWGGAGNDYAEAVDIAADGSIYIAGHQESYGAGLSDSFLAKFDSSGTLQWSRIWGGTQYDYAESVTVASDGSIYLAGRTQSYGAGGDEVMLLKYQSDGTLVWERVWGGTANEYSYDMTELVDGSFVTIGATGSFGGDTASTFIVKFTADGTITMNKVWASAVEDYAYAVDATDDGGFVVAGKSAFIPNASWDVMVVKHDSEGNVEWERAWGGSSEDGAESIRQTEDGGYLITGYTQNYGGGLDEMLVLKMTATGEIDNCVWICKAPLNLTRSTITPTVTTPSGTVGSPSVTTTTPNASVGRNRNFTRTEIIAPNTGPKQSTFARAWGGANTEFARDITQTSDGGYLLSGTTSTGGIGGQDTALMRYDASGTAIWTRYWGGLSTDYGESVIETDDGGFLELAYTNSYGQGNNDAIIIKYDIDGIVEWKRTWGGLSNDNGYSLIQTNDGNYVITGVTASYGAGNNDMFIAKFGSTGTLMWSQVWGGSGIDDIGWHVVETPDGGLAVAGQTNSFGAGNADGFLARFDSNGNHQWTKTWGGANNDIFYSLVNTSDGGFAVTGSTASYGGGSDDLVLVKFSGNGTLMWSQTWGSTAADYGYELIETSDRGLAITGKTASYGAGGDDALLVKYSEAGSLEWSRTFGSVSTEVGESLVQSNDGGFVIAGETNGYGAGGRETLIAKYNAAGDIVNCSSPDCQSPTASTASPSVTLGTPTPTTSSPSASTGSVAGYERAEILTQTNVQTGSINSYRGRPLSAVNIPVPAESETVFSLRLEINISKWWLMAGYDNFKLQYAPRIGTCDTTFVGEQYADVSGSSDNIQFFSQGTLSNGASVEMSDISSFGPAAVAQRYINTNTFSNNSALSYAKGGVWDFILKSTSSGGGDYCFRIVKSDGTPLTTYGSVAEVAVGQGNLQTMRHGRWFDTAGSARPFSW